MKTQHAFKYRTLPVALFPHIVINSCDSQALYISQFYIQCLQGQAC